MISAVEMSHFVFPFLPYLPYPYLMKLRWRMFGTLKAKGVDRLLDSLSSLMIGKWKAWSAF